VDESLEPAVNARPAVIARRAVIAGILGSLPICKLADAAVRPPAAPAVSPPSPSPYAAAANELMSVFGDLSGSLNNSLNIQQNIDMLAALAGQDQSTGNRDQLAERLREMERQIVNLQAEVRKREQLGIKISQLQALVGNVAASPQDCNRLTGQLYTAGYLGDAQIAAMSRGQFQWSSAEIQSAVMRGSAAADAFMAPISAQLHAQHDFLNEPGTLPQRAP
jgi:hypothetical protein